MTYRHCIDKRFATDVERTSRVLEVGEAFGLGLDRNEFVIYDQFKFTTEPGDCIYITGQSGSGKSLLLNQLTEDYRAAGLTVGVLDEVMLDEKPLIDQLGSNTDEACRLLSQAGLNDAYLFVRKPSELSDGQRYRFKVAKLLASGAQVLIADEFGAVLDRVTAKVIAYAISKLCAKQQIILAVATTHKDLYWDLQPTLTIDKQFAHQMKSQRTSHEYRECY